MSLNIGMSLSGPTIGISPDFGELINAINKKEDISEKAIENIHFPLVGQSTMSWKLEVITSMVLCLLFDSIRRRIWIKSRCIYDFFKE